MKYSIYIPVLSLLLNSCVVIGTLHPISDKEADFVFKKELLGRWGDTANSSFYRSVDTTAGTNGKYYTIKIVDFREYENKADTSCLTARLAYINNSYFLDCQICEDSVIKNYGEWLIRTHFFVKLNFLKNENIEMLFPCDEILINLIDKKKIDLNYIELSKDNYLIIDKPKKLKNTAISLAKFPSVYCDTTILQRLK